MALCLAGAGGVWATWPLALRVQTATIGKVDAWPAAWQINWLQHVLLTDPLGWSAANIFFPYENALATSDLLLTPALLTLPALASESLVLAYNLAFLGGIALCGLAGYLLIDELTGSSWAAIAGAAMLALNPFRFLHIEHLSIIAAWPPVLLCWALLRFFRKPGAVGAAGVAAAGLLAVGASLYQALYLAPLLPLVVAFAAARGVNDFKTWRTLGGATLAAVPALVILAYPFWEGMAVRGVPWSPNDLRRFAADVTSLAAPPPFMEDPTMESSLNPEARLYPGVALSILGLFSVVTALLDARKRDAPGRWILTASLGTVGLVVVGLLAPGDHALRRAWELALVGAVWAVPLLLAAWAVLVAVRRPAANPGAAVALGLAGASSALALSFGPYVHVRGEAVGAAPYSLLVAISGIFEGTRVPARFGGLVVVFLSLAAAGALARIVELPAADRSRRPVIAVLSLAVLAAVAVDLPAAPWGFEAVPDDSRRPAYAWLATMPDDFGLLELPDDGDLLWERGYYMLASKYHWKRLANGTAGQVPALHEKFYDTEPWSDEFFVFVRSYLPVRFVLVHERQLPLEVRTELLPRLALGHQGWRRAYEDRDVRIFEVDRGAESGPFVERLFLRAPLVPAARVSFEARVVSAAEVPLRLELLLDDEPFESWPIDAQWRRLVVDVPLTASTPVGQNVWPRTTALFRWQLGAAAGGELQLRGIDARPAAAGAR